MFFIYLFLIDFSEKNIDVREKYNINQLPPIRALIGNLGI